MTVRIIAEIGGNHGGDFGVAKEMAQEFLKNKYVSFIKFQWGSWIPDKLQKHEYEKLAQICGNKFLASVFDVESAEQYFDYTMSEIVKIPAGEVGNYPLMKSISRMQPSFALMSRSGLSTTLEWIAAIQTLAGKRNGVKKIIPMHCVSHYPCHTVDSGIANCWKMAGQSFPPKQLFGFSDHTQLAIAAIQAVTLGAKFIEKHVTLSTDLPGSDNAISMTPERFLNYCKAIKLAEAALSAGEKYSATQDELNLRKKYLSNKKKSIGEKNA